MSTPLVITDILEVKAYCNAADGQLSINRTHWRVSAVTTASVTPEEAAIALEATLGPPYKNFLPASAGWYGLTVKKLTAPASIPYPSFALRAVGNGGALLVPKQATALIHIRTDEAGADQRGRLFIPFIDAANVGPAGEINLVGMPLLTAIKNAYGLSQTIVGIGGTATMNLMIYNPAVIAPIRLATFIGVTNQVATQKSRGAFGKTNSFPF